MCGLAGYINLSNKQKPINEKYLHAMQQSLTHRGPNDYGIWKSDKHQIGLAHRRLSIIDLSNAGQQPMLNKSKTIAICFNGEIYNHKQIRKELESAGHTYKSQTDTETLIHAYQKWGIRFLHKLEGMFAIAIFDLEKNELFLIRDRIGIKPLYFSTKNNYLSFASEIKALWDLPWMKKNISDQAFYHYLTFMVTPAPYTIFDQIYKLPAGFYAKIDTNKNLSFHEWYTPIKPISNHEKKQFENEQFCIENIRHLLKESTKKRMMSDVPFGAFLSGGIDSSLNVALMAEAIGKVKTFTVSFSDGPETNELKWARLIAKKFDTDHHEIIISEKEAFEFYEKMVYHLDEPLADPVCIPFYHVAQLAKNSGVTVAQVGEGSDELFFGYNIYAKYKNLYSKFWHPTQKIIPPLLKKGLYQAAKKIFPNKEHYLEIMHNWSYNKTLFWGGAIAFGEYQKNKLLNKNFLSQNSFQEDPIVKKIYPSIKQNLDSHNIVHYHLSNLKKLDSHADFIKQMTYLELKQRLPELLLMRADKMAMAASVESRVPFLDHKLVEFALNIPEKLKFKNKITKYILKKACEKIIPDEIIHRKKIGFASPIVRWFKNGKYFPQYFQKLNQKKTNKQFKYNKSKLSKNNNYSYAIQKWVLQNYLTLK